MVYTWGSGGISPRTSLLLCTQASWLRNLQGFSYLKLPSHHRSSGITDSRYHVPCVSLPSHPPSLYHDFMSLRMSKLHYSVCQRNTRRYSELKAESSFRVNKTKSNMSLFVLETRSHVARLASNLLHSWVWSWTHDPSASAPRELRWLVSYPVYHPCFKHRVRVIRWENGWSYDNVYDKHFTLNCKHLLTNCHLLCTGLLRTYLSTNFSFITVIKCLMQATL